MACICRRGLSVREKCECTVSSEPWGHWVHEQVSAVSVFVVVERRPRGRYMTELDIGLRSRLLVAGRKEKCAEAEPLSSS